MLSKFLNYSVGAVALGFYLLLFLAAWCRRRTATLYPKGTVGFVHPAAAAGGGGERVLWLAVEGLMKADIAAHTDRTYVLYCCCPANKGDQKMVMADAEILDKAREQFGITLPRPVKFVHLRPCITKWLDGNHYPLATLLLQTVWGGCLLFYECAVVHGMTPIVVESVGIPMTYPLFRLVAGCTMIAYIHFPVISSRMMDMVRGGIETNTNRGRFVSNAFLRWMKTLYYLGFMQFYRLLGQFPHLVFTNSTWTNRHIRSLFKPRKSINILFPPCRVEGVFLPPGETSTASRRNRIVSVGQFRPEKDHTLQIRSFHKALPSLPSDTSLALIGGCRNAEDRERVEGLRKLVRQLGLSSRVEIRVDEPFDALQEELRTSYIGLHTMRDEHFGIVVVEYMAAGCIPLAHRSGGVELDIVKDAKLGYLAATEEEFTTAMISLFQKKEHSPAEMDQMRVNARAHALSFDDSQFQKQFVMHLERQLMLLAADEEEEDETGRTRFHHELENTAVSFEEYAMKHSLGLDSKKKQ